MDLVSLLALTLIVYMLLPGPNNSARQKVWNGEEADEVKGKMLNSEFGKLEDRHSRGMESAMSFKNRKAILSDMSDAYKVRDYLKSMIKS
mgnify:CR=1 FL=1